MSRGSQQDMTENLKNSKFKNLLSKESLNSDGQQFHQYQQNEQSPFTSLNVRENKRKKKTTEMNGYICSKFVNITYIICFL